MCILFFEVKNNPKANEFALVLVNNRDENYDRPTLVSHYWKECPQVIGGRDAYPGKEGGTWIGMSKKGKIGVLLNILQPLDEENPSAKGRGNLVANYITSNTGCDKYLNNIAEEGNLYNSFHLVTMETRLPPSGITVVTYNNVDGNPPTHFSEGIHTMGNSLQQTPFRKVKYGRAKFTDVVNQYATIECKQELIEELVKLLNDDTTHWPDPQVEKQGRCRTKEFLERLTAIKVVNTPGNCYGTRTNTIILVDSAGNVDVIERTMEEPIDPHAPKWLVTQHTFQLM